MHRFFLESTLIGPNQVCFPADIAKQIRRVLRLNEGDSVLVLDHQGSIYEVSLEFVDTHDVIGRVLMKEPASGEPKTQLWLYLCVSQREKFELILQKCTELGAVGIVPVISSRTLVQDTDSVEKKRERWERILKEAAEQSHRGRVPVLASAMRYTEALDDARQHGGTRLFLWEEAQTRSLRSVLEETPCEVTHFSMLVGPEGGLSEEEAEGAKASGFQLVSLGERILRMETAAIAGTAMLMFARGEME